MSGHFGFAKLIVSDLDSSARFYEAVMGLVPQIRINTMVADREITEIVYKPTAPGAGRFTLVAYHDTSIPPLGEAIMGFATGDLDAFLGRVVDHGGAVVVAPFENADAPGMKIAFATDPDGHLMEVIQRL